MRIRGAVLEEIGRQQPFAASVPITVGDVDLALPGPGELLIRIEAASLCHSDLSVVNGHRVRPVPMLLGHEAAGIVQSTGDGVVDVHVGDRVVLTFLPRCGVCEGCQTDGIRPCIPGSQANGAGSLMSGAHRLSRAGEPVHHHLGVSAFATHAVVDRRSVVKVDHDVPPAVAAVLGCAVLTGGGAVINVARPQAGDTVVIVGLGGVGMAAVLTALSIDGVQVVAVDPVEAKLALARTFGAHEALTPAEAAARGVQGTAVIEAVGNAAVLEAAIDLTAPGGRTITVGLPAPDARSSFSPTSLVADGRSIVGSYLGSAVPERDIPRFLELWRQGRLPVEQLVSETMKLDDINQGMDKLASGEALRQVIEFEQDE